MPSFFTEAKQSALPNSKEWLWDINGLETRVLRTACLHEYVRETPYLIEYVKRIDSLMKKVGWSIQDCKNLLNGILPKMPVGEGLNIAMDLIGDIETLAGHIFPLPPHVLLGRNLEQTPFFSLPAERRTGTDDDLLPDGLFSSSTVSKKSIFKLNLGGLKQSLRCWIAKVEMRTTDEITVFHTEHESPYFGKEPPDDLFENENGLQYNNANVLALVAKPEAFHKVLPRVLACLLLGNTMKLPKNLEGVVFRLKLEITKGLDSLSVIQDIDGLVGQKTEPFTAIIMKPEFGMLEIVRSIQIVTDSLPTTNSYSVLSDRQRIVPNKKNGFFYETALRQLSALRMGHSISADQHDALVSLWKNRSTKEQKKHTVFITVVSTVLESRTKYLAKAKKIFPKLDSKERRPRTQKGNWTILK